MAALEHLPLLGVALVALIALGLLRSRWFKGVRGEARVNSSLRRRLNRREYQVLKDLTLPAGDGTTQIDHIVVSRFGVFVIETKNMKGWIFGSPDQATWTQVLWRRKTKFQNPIRQNYWHVKVVQELLGISSHKVHSIVAFVGAGIPKTAMPDQVVWGARSLAKHIQSKGVAVFDESELGPIVERLSANRLRAGLRTRNAHVKHVKAQLTARQDKPAKCPRCGGKMIERNYRQSGARFLGCSRFPRCNGTRQMS